MQFNYYFSYPTSTTPPSTRSDGGRSKGGTLSEGEALFTKRNKTDKDDYNTSATVGGKSNLESFGNEEDGISYYRRQQQSPRSNQKSEYSGLLSESRREVLDFTSTRKRPEQEKEQELERAKAKATSKDNSLSSDAKAVPTASLLSMTNHQLESTILPPPKPQQQPQLLLLPQPAVQEALESEGNN